MVLFCNYSAVYRLIEYICITNDQTKAYECRKSGEYQVDERA